MSSLAALRVTMSPLEDACIIRASGELDAGNLELLRSPLDGARADRRTTIVDLSGIRFIDSAGLGLLLAAAWAADDEEWAWFLVRLSDAVLRIVELTETAGLLPLVVPAIDGVASVARAASRGSGAPHREVAPRR